MYDVEMCKFVILCLETLQKGRLELYQGAKQVKVSFHMGLGMVYKVERGIGLPNGKCMYP